MSYQGVDTVARISPAQAQALKAEDVSFVGRYLGPAAWGKTIKPDEAKTLLDNGLAILLCYETTAARMREGATAGAQDGAQARQCAIELGVPEGTAIYFACDFDVQPAELTACEQYVNAAKQALGTGYEVGVYGPERIVAHLSERSICRRFWQCVAWSRVFLPQSNVQQYAWQGDGRSKEMAVKTGIAAVDLDSCEDLTGAGMWTNARPWYADAMDWTKRKGLMNDGRPNDPMTRAEVATVLYRIFGGGS